MAAIIFIVRFNTLHGEREATLPAHWGGVHSVKDGFWVDKDWQTGGVASNSRYWIPPSQILFVEKIEESVKPQREARDGDEKED